MPEARRHARAGDDDAWERRGEKGANPLLGRLERMERAREGRGEGGYPPGQPLGELGRLGSRGSRGGWESEAVDAGDLDRMALLRKESQELKRRQEDVARRLREEERLKQQQLELRRQQAEIERRLRDQEGMTRREEEARRRLQEEALLEQRREEKRRLEEERAHKQRREEKRRRLQEEEEERRLREQDEMASLRRQQEELKRRHEALLLEEREMDARLREKADALRRMQQRPGLGGGLDGADYSPERSAPSSATRRKVSGRYSSGNSSDRHFAPGSTHGCASDGSSDSSPDRVASRRDEKYAKSKPRSPFRRGGRGLRAAVAVDRERMHRAKVVVRKILRAVFTDLDDETLMREDTEPVLVAITLLKEAMIGLLIAFAIVSLILFIDHRFLLGLPTARNFRRATYHLMDDKETLQNFEAETGLKFLPEEEYASMKEEIAKAANRTQLATSILQQRSRDLVSTQEDMKKQAEAMSRMIKRLELDRYCEQCLWNEGRGRTCHIQSRAMEAKYQTPKFAEFFKLIKKQSCENLEDKLVRNWQRENDFCDSCEIEPGESCSARADRLSQKYGVPADRSRARLLIKTVRCRQSNYDEETSKVKNFCTECLWDDSRTCQQRAGYLMYKGKYSARTAILSAMKNEACYKKQDVGRRDEAPGREAGKVPRPKGRNIGREGIDLRGLRRFGRAP